MKDAKIAIWYSIVAAAYKVALIRCHEQKLGYDYIKTDLVQEYLNRYFLS